MNNNDVLVRLRYALDIKDMDMVEIFKLGGIKTTIKETQKMLVKLNNHIDIEDFQENEYEEKCDNYMLECFLNGLIIKNRGKQDAKTADSRKQEQMITSDQSVNNVMLKKVKIALSLTSEDILDILDETGVTISKNELSAVLRKEGHRNYKVCGDRYARNFLKGLAIRYRD